MSRGRCDGNTANDGARSTEGEHQDKVISYHMGDHNSFDTIIISHGCVAPITIEYHAAGPPAIGRVKPLATGMTRKTADGATLSR